MASRPETRALEVWPLGTFTITPGTPIALTSIVGPQETGSNPQTQYTGGPKGHAFTATCRGLVFSTAGNAGLIYLNDGNWPGRDVNRTVTVIGPNQPNVEFPPAGLTQGVMDINRYYIDGTTAGDLVTITAVDASS